MARRKLEPEDYRRVLDGYRQGLTIAGICRHSGLSREGVESLWLKGLKRKERKLDMEPIRDLIEREQVQIRAEMQRSRERDAATIDSEASLALKQALEARQQEAQLVQLGRASAIQGLATSVNMTLVARKLGERAREDIEKRMKLGEIEPELALRWLQRIADICAKLMQQALAALELERRFLNEPDKIIELRHKVDAQSAEAAELTWAEVEARMLASQDVYNRLRTLGPLDSLEDPGLDEPVLGVPVVVQ